jgi:hypothetical protein
MGAFVASSRRRAFCFARGGISLGTIAERQQDTTLTGANVIRSLRGN